MFFGRKYEKLSNLEECIQNTQKVVAEKTEDPSDWIFEDIVKEKQENTEDKVYL